MAQQKNLIVDQGSHWSANIIVYTSNATGTFSANLYQYANGVGQIRKSYTSANSTANIAVSVHPSGSANNGTIILSMNNSVTGAITGGRYLYDVEIVGGPAVTGFSDGSENNKILRVCEGTINITPQVTKWDWN